MMVRAMPNAISRETANLIVKLWNDGERDLDMIAIDANVSRSTVRNYLDKRGIVMPKEKTYHKRSAYSGVDEIRHKNNPSARNSGIPSYLV